MTYYESAALGLPGPDGSRQVRDFVRKLNHTLKLRSRPGEPWRHDQEHRALEPRIRTLLQLEQMFGEQRAGELTNWLDQILIAEMVSNEFIAEVEPAADDVVVEIRTRAAEMQDKLASDVGKAVIEWYIEAIEVSEALGRGE